MPSGRAPGAAYPLCANPPEAAATATAPQIAAPAARDRAEKNERCIMPPAETPAVILDA
ncbi:MAG TPA: hypothetical protein VME70_04110 [Mycobacteriales bacterium]|nr:hypothetical protein [Mycobacteriales bacterium]